MSTPATPPPGDPRRPRSDSEASGSGGTPVLPTPASQAAQPVPSAPSADGNEAAAEQERARQLALANNQAPPSYMSPPKVNYDAMDKAMAAVREADKAYRQALSSNSKVEEAKSALIYAENGYIKSLKNGEMQKAMEQIAKSGVNEQLIQDPQFKQVRDLFGSLHQYETDKLLEEQKKPRPDIGNHRDFFEEYMRKANSLAEFQRATIYGQNYDRTEKKLKAHIDVNEKTGAILVTTPEYQMAEFGTAKRLATELAALGKGILQIGIVARNIGRAITKKNSERLFDPVPSCLRAEWTGTARVKNAFLEATENMPNAIIKKYSQTEFDALSDTEKLSYVPSSPMKKDFKSLTDKEKQKAMDEFEKELREKMDADSNHPLANLSSKHKEKVKKLEFKLDWENNVLTYGDGSPVSDEHYNLWVDEFGKSMGKRFSDSDSIKVLLEKLKSDAPNTLSVSTAVLPTAPSEAAP